MLVDRWIRIEPNELSGKKRNAIKAKLTFYPDPTEPDYISCYREQSDGVLLLPRGAWAFPELDELSYWDRRVKPRMPELEFKGTLDYEGNGKRFVGQRKAVYSMVENEQGTIVRSPGTGKSIIALNFIAKAKTRALVIVNTDDIIDQWEDYANEFIPDIEVGRIKAERFEIAHLTLATIQTMNRRLEEGELSKDFWKQFGILIVDEVHHAPATTYERLINASPAHYRFGFSASETRSDSLEPIIGYLFGPKIHIYKPKATMPVQVDKVRTSLNYNLGGGSVYAKRKSWHAMIDHMINDPDRNNLIAEKTDELIAEGRSTLLLSNRIEHLTNIHELMDYKDDAVILTGRMSRVYRRETLQKFREGKVKCVLATQLANEALDIPILSALVLSFPAKHKDGIFQKVGRTLREHPGKTSVKIVDIVDHRIPTLRRQWYERRDFYKGEGYKITADARNVAEAFTSQLSFFTGGRRAPTFGIRRS
jgi:superfamily II DNA or RNA helicase